MERFIYKQCKLKVVILQEGPRRGGDLSGSAETTNGDGRRSIKDGSKGPEGLDKGSNKRKGPRYKKLGHTCECEKVSVMRRTHPNGTDTDNNGANY